MQNTTSLTSLDTTSLTSLDTTSLELGLLRLLRTRHGPTGPDRTRQEPIGPDRTRRDPTGPNRTRQDPTGPDRTRRGAPSLFIEVISTPCLVHACFLSLKVCRWAPCPPGRLVVGARHRGAGWAQHGRRRGDRTRQNATERTRTHQNAPELTRTHQNANERDRTRQNAPECTRTHQNTQL